MEDPGPVVDQGNQQARHFQSDLEGEIAGHRAVFVGVHIPLKSKNRHKHKHRSKKKKGNGDVDHDDGNGISIQIGGATPPTTRATPVEPPCTEYVEQPKERVRFILGEDENGEDGEHEIHDVFTEMDELYQGGDGELPEWKETARWIKYEEDVEEGADRWSKPHISTLSLHSLFELRNCILTGTVCLDMNAENLDQIADLVLDKFIVSGQLDEEDRSNVREALLCRHRHQYEKKHRDSKRHGSLLPGIRSLVDIGRSLSGSYHHANMEQALSATQSTPAMPRTSFSHGSHLGVVDGSNTPPSGSLPHVPSAQSMKAKHHFMKKIPAGAEASNVLVGEVDFLSRPVIAFVRLEHSVLLGDLTEVPIPTRFLFILLGPPSEETARYHEIGRCIATLMSDEVFHEVAYKANNRDDLLAGIDEFMDQVTVLPPGVWDPNIRIEPPKVAPPPTHRLELDHHDGCRSNGYSGDHGEDEEKKEGLERTGRIFGGLVKDIKRRGRHYLSDFTDALHLQCLASVFFMYFACITPVITFGGLLGDATDQQMATLESLLGAFICGVAFSLFAGQPLTILGSTGPILIYEKILVGFCDSTGLEYLPFRWWIGIWTAVLCLILVATDASSLVRYFTRFTEESFSTLISAIFIFEAFHKLYSIYEQGGENAPIGNATYDCSCERNESALYDYIIREDDLFEVCGSINSTLYHDPSDTKFTDKFLMSTILMIGTFKLAYTLKIFKNTPYFPTAFRTIVSHFSVFSAVVVMIFVDYLCGIDTPKLNVPATFKPTAETRDYWFVPPFADNPWWTAIAAVIPAFLAVILVFMDQQITAVIVNRRENKLKKGVGYHLDLTVVAVMLALCSILGLPWFVAATVLSINHVNSLKVESECSAPGEPAKFFGCREQRVTGLAVFILIGLAVLMTPLLQIIPMPVLYGVFLYMGVSSLEGVQFVDRIKLFFMPAKHQPDYIFLRQVELRRVHVFTAVQLSCLVILWIMKTTKAALVFPVMVLGTVGVRKLLDYVFTQRELGMLDDVMPERVKRDKLDQKKKEEEMIAQEEREMAVCEEMKNMPGSIRLPLSDGNMLSIPVGKVEFHPDRKVINISDEMAKTGIWKALVNNASSAELSRKNSIEYKQAKEKAMNNCGKELSTIPGSPSPERAPLLAPGNQDGDIIIEVPEIKTQSAETTI
ncbi:sodium-driven chloride bicarbonate exchanger-like isoform X2 [Antedon mediterranea]